VRSFSSFHLLWVILAAFATFASGQCAAQGAEKSHTPAQITMTECEGTNNCATWTFVGTQGTGKWPSGELSNLIVERLDDNSVVIRRADSTGPSAGLTALYTGTRHGDRIGGEFTSSWQGHGDDKTGYWYATISRNQQDLPPAMRMCLAPNYNVCWDWTWNSGHYDGVMTNGDRGTMTTESFTPELIVLRVKTARYSAVVTGKISSQANSVVNADWSNTLGQAGLLNIAWGSALAAVPPSANFQDPAPQRQVTDGNNKPSESSKTLPTDEASNAEIDAGFRRWSAGWMFDRYVPGSARATERALKQDTYVIRGMFDFVRGGGRLSIPYAASYSKSNDRYLLSNLCYNDTSTGMTDCVNPSNPEPMQNRQFLGSIVLLGMVAAMASDETCVKRYTFFGSAYLECDD
jgi:hypothetical protein